MGATEVGLLEFSAGPEKPRPEIFQSDCHASVDVFRADDIAYFGIYEDSIRGQIAVH